VTLETLLDRALVSQYQRGLWFRFARLSGNSLLVSDIDDHDTIQRCFLPELVKFYPPLVLTFSPSRDAVEKPKKAPEPAFKKAYYGQQAAPRQRDML
jgi:hypothetical protein